MAQTVTSVSACDIAISLDDADGTLQNISGSSNRVRIRFFSRYHQNKHFDTAAPWKALLWTELDISLVILYSTADDEGLDILRNWFDALDGKNARTLRLDVPDGSVGDHRYECEAVWLNMDLPLEADDAGAVAVRARLRSTNEYSVTEVTTSTSTSTTSSSTSTSSTSTSTTTTSTSISTTSSSTSTTQSTSTTTT